MMAEPDIASIQRAYRELTDRLRGLGFVLPGSITERWTTCGKPGCPCATEPAHRHGPYLEYTRKIAGRTRGRRITPVQAEQYRGWIANRRLLDQITADMDELSQQAAHLLTNPEQQ
jgi:hypothetical protein